MLYDLPHELNELLAGSKLERISTGESGAAVWRCTSASRPPWYLKSGPVEAQLGLAQEAACLRWMRDRGLCVPRVLVFASSNEHEYLLTESATGTPASADEWHAHADRVAAALGRGLAQLHRTDVSTCPFDRRVARQLEEARTRVDAGVVREDDFDEIRLGRSAADLFGKLLTAAPAAATEQDLVLVHGDFCLPNVLLAREDDDIHVTGYVDCGRAGVGDRHQDLALAVRSLTYNLGAGTVAPFLRAYDGPPIDPRRLDFFTVLDEFF
jgi:aminoglycoside 3'-phosphotransferase-2